MLRILDRYILKHYLQTLAICFISLVGLYTVVDALSHLDDFLTHAPKYGGLFSLLTNYYGVRALSFFDRTSAILALMASIFTLLWLRNHNEMTALMAAGVSKLRILKPVLIASLLLFIVAAINRETLLPMFRAELMRDSRQFGKTEGKALQGTVDAQTGIIISGESAHVASQTIKNPQFVLPVTLANLGTQLVAEKAKFVVAADEKPGGYLLSNVDATSGILKQPSLQLSGEPVVLTPFDTPWLKEDQVFVVSGLTLEQVAEGNTWQNYATTAELIRHAKSPSIATTSDVQVAVHSRFLRPFLDATLLFIGLPIILARGGSNIFLSIGLCVGIVALFFVVTIICQFVGSSQWTTPALAAWLPLLIFAPIAVMFRGALTS